MFRKVLIWMAAAVFAATASAIWPAAASAAAPSQPVEVFRAAADALYEATLQGRDEEMLRRLLETDRAFRALPMDRIATAEGVEALAGSISRMKRAAAALTPDPARRAAAAAALRLAADALAHPDKPLWHRYRSLLLDQAEALRKLTAAEAPAGEIAASLGVLQARYAAIRTAVLLRAEPSVVERTDAVLRYAERVLLADHPDPAMRAGVFPPLREALAGLFPDAGKEQAAVALPIAGPPWAWPAVMGSFIVTVLSWAGWQRYKHPSPVTPRGTLPPGRRERH